MSSTQSRPGSPDDAVALIANGGPPSVTLLSGLNVIVCKPCVTVKLWVRDIAAR